MSAAEFLLQIRVLERTIWRLTMKRDELQSCLLPSAIRYDLDKVQTSPEDRLAEIAGEVLEIERKLRTLRERKACLVIEISAAIDRLEDDREKTILTAYYIGRHSMTDIADVIGYSLPHTYRLRRSGVQHVEDLKDDKNDKAICGML